MYGDWVDELPVISEAGEYTLNPVQSENNNVFKIKSPNSSSEFFIVEYRKKEGMYDSNTPGTQSGLLIYRINGAMSGQGNAQGPPDEVYLYRPGGTASSNGNFNQAIFNQESGRDTFNDTTNPKPFLYSGEDGGINIINIGTPGETITFTLAPPVAAPEYLVAAATQSSVELNWNAPSKGLDNYRVYRNNTLVQDNVTETKFIDNDVTEGQSYEYYITAVYSGTTEGESGPSNKVTVVAKKPSSLPYNEDFEASDEWTEINYGDFDIWKINNSDDAGGEAPELRAKYLQDKNGVTRYITPALNSTGTTQLDLKFKHYYKAYQNGVTIKIQSSTNMNEWTDEEWVHEPGSTNMGPEAIATKIKNNLGGPLYLSFTIEGDLGKFTYWYIDDIEVNYTTSIGTETLPENVELFQNYPNPFNPSTTISFNLSKAENVKLSVYNYKGELVRELVNTNMKAGNKSVQWNGTDLKGNTVSSGIYYYRLKTNGYAKTMKAIMVK